ncbi:MAG TPA: cytochrome ubiquinol oxidase subunit I [Roseiarcus sp.]
MDPVVLSRIQFAWVIAFHFLLPAFTVGLASFIAVMEGLNCVTGCSAARFWDIRLRFLRRPRVRWLRASSQLQFVAWFAPL